MKTLQAVMSVIALAAAIVALVVACQGYLVARDYHEWQHERLESQCAARPDYPNCVPDHGGWP